MSTYTLRVINGPSIDRILDSARYYADLDTRIIVSIVVQIDEQFVEGRLHMKGRSTRFPLEGQVRGFDQRKYLSGPLAGNTLYEFTLMLHSGAGMRTLETIKGAPISAVRVYDYASGPREGLIEFIKLQDLRDE